MVKEFHTTPGAPQRAVPSIIFIMPDLNVVVAPLIPVQSGPVEDEIVPGSA